MTKMNWERASQRSRMYDGMGYLDIVEAADERWQAREDARDARLEAARATRSAKKAVRPLTKAEKRALVAEAKSLGMPTDRYGETALRQLFSGIGGEATKLTIDVAVLRRRRLLALRAGHTVKEILDAGRIDGPIGSGPLAKSSRSRGRARKAPTRFVGPLPISTTERLRREAEGSGGAAASRPPVVGTDRSKVLITSRGAGQPPAPRDTTLRPAAAPKKAGAARTKQTKAQRDRAAASRRGISVAELLTERRAKAADDTALAAGAKALGMTTKQLRKQRST